MLQSDDFLYKIQHRKNYIDTLHKNGVLYVDVKKWNKDSQTNIFYSDIIIFFWICVSWLQSAQYKNENFQITRIF